MADKNRFVFFRPSPRKRWKMLFGNGGFGHYNYTTKGLLEEDDTKPISRTRAIQLLSGDQVWGHQSAFPCSRQRRN